MAETSAIEWTDSTFNPWIGCTKIAPACDNCYAADWAKRYRTGQDLWGKGPRQRTALATWKQPLKWHREAAAFQAQHGRRQRVFCASLADVFDNQVPAEWRHDLWSLIEQCWELDWLLLTKRPQNIEKMLPDTPTWENIRRHVWLGTTVEDQEHADRNLPHLLKHDAAVRFISAEPLLGQMDLMWALSHNPLDLGAGYLERGHFSPPLRKLRPLDWVIAGGESGSNWAPGRPSHPDWFISLRDQCAAAGVPFLFKQWGSWVVAPAGMTQHEAFLWAQLNKVGRPAPPSGHWGGDAGGHPTLWENLAGDRYAFPAPKARAGRLLDGVEHNGFPEVRLG